MNNYLDLLLLFTIYSFLGWVLETIFVSIDERKLTNRGFLAGFFCPIYGFGAILVIQSSKWVTTVFINYFKALIISIIFAILLVTALEYITGLLLEKLFNKKWWDYSNEEFNLHGYICLKKFIYMGLFSVHTSTICTSCNFRNSFFCPNIS